MKTGVELIAEERREQIEKHGRSIENDVFYNESYELATAARALTLSEGVERHQKPEGWNETIWNHMARKSYKDRLVIAGALIAAEIDRLNATKLP